MPCGMQGARSSRALLAPRLLWVACLVGVPACGGWRAPGAREAALAFVPALRTAAVSAAAPAFALRPPRRELPDGTPSAPALWPGVGGGLLVAPRRGSIGETDNLWVAVRECARSHLGACTSLRMAASSEPPTNATQDGQAEVGHIDDPVIVVVDMETSQTIESFIDQRVYIGKDAEKQEVLLCYPADVPVVIAQFDSDDMLAQVPMSTLDARGVFSAASSHLRDKGLDLIKSAVCLTIQGDLEEGEDQANPAEVPVDDDDSMSVRVIATLEHEGQEYIITEPLDPVLMLAVASAEAEDLGAPLVLAQTCGADDRPMVFCQLLKGSSIQDVLPHVEKYLGRRFTQTYAGYGSSL